MIRCSGSLARARWPEPFWGLAVAFAIKLVRKTRKLPKWPIAAGAVLGLIPALQMLAEGEIW